MAMYFIHSSTFIRFLDIGDVVGREMAVGAVEHGDEIEEIGPIVGEEIVLLE